MVTFNPIVFLIWPALVLFCVHDQRSWLVGLFEATAITLLVAAIIPKG